MVFERYVQVIQVGQGIHFLWKACQRVKSQWSVKKENGKRQSSFSGLFCCSRKEVSCDRTDQRGRIVERIPASFKVRHASGFFRVFFFFFFFCQSSLLTLYQGIPKLLGGPKFYFQKATSHQLQALSPVHNRHTGRLRLNLKPLNLVRWIDSWPLDKNLKTRLKRFNVIESIQRPGYESRVNLDRDAEPRPKVVLEGFALYFLHLYGPTAVTTGQIQCRAIISRDFRRFSRTRFTRWIFCIFHRRRPLLENSSQSASDREKFNAKLTQTSKLHDS